MKHPNPKTRKQHGFSFLEIIVVLSILSVLAALLTPYAFDMQEKAKISKMVQTYHTLLEAVENYHKERLMNQSNLNPNDSSLLPASVTDLQSTGHLARTFSSGDNPFGGTVSLTRVLTAGADWTFISGGPALDGPYCIVQFTAIPQEVANKLDFAIDQTENASFGKLHYTNDASGGTATVEIFLVDLNGQ